MNRDAVLAAVFPQERLLEENEPDFFSGTALAGEETVRFVGTANAVEVGVALALRIAAVVIDTMRRFPGRPLVLLLDTAGQRLRRHDELLGLNGYMAHMAKCLEVARTRGHPVISLVYGQAVSGGYLTTGMMADAAFALEDAEIKVMNLPAMARITKIPLERLEALALQSAVFSPGARNYYRMGHIEEMWSDDLAQRLHAAIAAVRARSPGDHRLARGLERGGRTRAHPVAKAVALGDERGITGCD